SRLQKSGCFCCSLVSVWKEPSPLPSRCLISILITHSGHPRHSGAAPAPASCHQCNASISNMANFISSHPLPALLMACVLLKNQLDQGVELELKEAFKSLFFCLASVHRHTGNN
uniref:Uncharacterized protein n=1 Tax=Catagonus wagneri TaxID=51154 RepID=A0A8C3W2W6_9CETA